MRNWKPVEKQGKGAPRRTCPAIIRTKGGYSRLTIPFGFEATATHVLTLQSKGVLGFRFGASGARIYKISETSSARAFGIPRWVGRLYPVGTTDVDLVKEDGVYVLTLPKGGA